MKIALYIENGLEQIVLTGESDLERSLLLKLSDTSRTMTIAHGSFYACQGGWVRQAATVAPQYQGARDDRSTMIVLRPKVDE